MFTVDNYVIIVPNGPAEAKGGLRSTHSSVISKTAASFTSINHKKNAFIVLKFV